MWHDQSSLFSTLPALAWIVSLLLRGILSTLICLIPLTLLSNRVAVEEKAKRGDTIQLLYWKCAFMSFFCCVLFFSSIFFPSFVCSLSMCQFTKKPKTKNQNKKKPKKKKKVKNPNIYTQKNLLVKFAVLLHNRNVYS